MENIIQNTIDRIERLEEDKAELLEALKRSEILLQATMDFIDKNPVKEYTVNYDDGKCDGACLHYDCQIHLEEIETAFTKASKGE